MATVRRQSAAAALPKAAAKAVPLSPAPADRVNDAETALLACQEEVMVRKAALERAEAGLARAVAAGRNADSVARASTRVANAQQRAKLAENALRCRTFQLQGAQRQAGMQGGAMP